ncbi:MAG: dihydrofolate reductase family protein [Rikenellaceae bacterium]|nr:dihydrofolate reductase family protein [Rikenellaceae bacterium]
MKIKTYSFISLDGYAAGDDNEAGRWLDNGYDSKEDYGLRELLDSVGSVVMNAMYYARLQGCDVWAFGDKTCYILSPHEMAAAAGTEIILHGDKDPVEALDVLRRRSGGDILLAGDTQTVAGFLEAGLIDEIVLNTVPVTLGRGTAFFGQSERATSWKLSGHKIYGNGVIQARYTADR